MKKTTISRLLPVAMLLILLVSSGRPASAHCEIPCGIYHDRMRIDMMKEDIETIEKSMKEINRLSKEKEPDYNQLIRWVTNKDNHVERIYETVTQYFMIQRVSPPKDGSDAGAQELYVKRITLLHRILLEGIRAKQTTNLEHCTRMRELVDEFDRAYFGSQKAEGHSHSH